MEKWTIDINGIPRDKNNNPLAFVQIMMEDAPGNSYMMYYAKNNRYFKRCVINGVSGRASRISFFEFIDVLKGESA